MFRHVERINAVIPQLRGKHDNSCRNFPAQKGDTWLLTRKNWKNGLAWNYEPAKTPEQQLSSEKMLTNLQAVIENTYIAPVWKRTFFRYIRSGLLCY